MPPASPRHRQRLFCEGLRGPAVRGDCAARRLAAEKRRRTEGGAPGGGSGAAAPLNYRANIQPLPPPPSPLPARRSESKDGDATVASGLPSSPKPLPAAQAEPPPPPSRQSRRIESSRSLREAPPARVLLPIGRGGKADRASHWL
ncbi:WAS/WASL-interacting protein family member 3-like [Hylobates moloch]|uniref:WAS/WASL-interacting protein family member 3-like n=1 Tax=Hylobates moloch TaxID=81572 RepID=UPI002675CFE2|nr:WAS/WASL-interacting protein family member 3-like [Hylobates moloch]XP_058284367.1 WAS/WASL-interacting protein family member 3-like [Hylobates moloch]